MRERLQKILAHAGIASRRKCEDLISAGKVTVNGRPVKLGDSADADVDDIRVGNRKIKKEVLKYYAINKPPGIVSTVSDPHGRKTVMQLVPRGVRVYPVGRLDKDAEGLLLLTNDGALANRLMHPRYETGKVYHVTLDREIRQEDIKKLRRGVRVWGRPVIPDKLIVHDPFHIEISLHEGRKHVVKLLFKNLDYEVVNLKRTNIANISLQDMPSGACRELSSTELAGLRRLMH